MRTSLAESIQHTAEGREADRILRSCVHCGFCTATCPTYQLLGDELDGPRGRIYLIKSLLEGQEVGRRTQLHLDRCLSCRACETTCPSDVAYGRLLDIGRRELEQRVRRPLWEHLARALLRKLVSYPNRFAALLRWGRRLRRWLPQRLRAWVPEPQSCGPWPAAQRSRRMLILDGCVQPALAPGINAAAARVLDRIGISVLRAEGCCGAVSHHLSADEEAVSFMRRNIDAWWPVVEAGAEALVATASGCGAMLKDYGHLLRHDGAYAARAARIAAMTRDICEVLGDEDLSGLRPLGGRGGRIAFHSPCTLQHGQRLNGITEALLHGLGFELTPVRDAHLCCGSAGTYSILQPSLSRRLLADKVRSLEAGEPELIATANIGCYHYLQQQASVPVKHWIELLDA